jgi:hypothetical protein
MPNKVFVSPGVYTSEKDLSFVTKSVGVTTLGLVGETTKGPAFQPIFVQDYGEFTSFFGGLNASKNKDTGAPKYELPYVAKSYLSKTNQLFVTRVLGLSGYDAGRAWAITADAELDSSTLVATNGTGTTYGSLFSFTADSSNVIVALTSSDSFIQTLFNEGLLADELNGIVPSSPVGSLASTNTVYKKTGSSFSGAGITNFFLTAVGTSGAFTTGTTSGVTVYSAGTSYSDVENKVLALLRSRAAYDGNESLNFEVTGGTYPIAFSTTATGAETDANGNFALTGTSSVSGAFQYDLSFDKTKNNYITKVLGRGAQDGKTAVYVEEIFSEMFNDFVVDGKIRGINLTLVDYSTKFAKYKQIYQPAVTPWVVSELRGSNLFRLFRFWTISDGDTANKLFKMSIINIKPDDKEFDLEIRNFYDTDSNKAVYEKYTKLSMDPMSNNYIAKRIGTLNGDFASKSNYVLIEMEEGTDISDTFPAGFVGYPIRKYETTQTGTAVSPSITYKKNYVGVTSSTQKRKVYQGLSDLVGIEEDFFTYKGVPDSTTINQWTGMTKGFHMDVQATGATIDNVRILISGTAANGLYYYPVFEFEVGNNEFRTEAGVQGGEYQEVYARKFTFAPYGGYDGWDVYRTSRTNNDRYIATGTKGVLGKTKGNFSTIALSNGDAGINSDYYAYLEAIWSFRNPEAVNINVFATPGIDLFTNSNLCEATIEMIETDRADSLYIANLPDIDAGGEVMTPEDVASTLDGSFDSNYTATYWPWVQVNDTENNVYIYMPPTRDVVRNIALTDNISFPWFAVAGIQRGDVDCIKARVKLTQEDRDVLYEARINPITTFASDGVKIWGNKTLQVKDTALNRINVRRLLLQARKLISAVSIRLLFEQNDSVVRNQFLTLVNPILDNIRANRGLTDFRVVLDDTPESIDRGELVGRIFLKPTKALEFITLEFNIMNTGASFDNI